MEKGKIVLTKDGFKEVTQQFYAIDRKTKTLNAVTVYADEKFTQEMAKLGKGVSVTALVLRPDSPHVLIKTPFGLTGWVKKCGF